MTVSSNSSDYVWADTWESLGFCLVVVDRVDAAEVLHRLVRRPDTPVLNHAEARAWMDEQRARSWSSYASVVEAARFGQWTLALESGYEAVMDGVPERLSEDGHQAAIVYRSVNADMLFIWAQDGRVVRRFDPLLDEQGGVGDRLPEEDGLTFGLEGPLAASFALTTRLTGVELSPRSLDHRESWLSIGHHPGT